MNAKLIGLLLALVVAMPFFSAGLAEAGNGTLTATLKYRNPATGAEQTLLWGYVYLRSAAKAPPLEKYLSKADYILGPAQYGDGKITVSVPEGSYFVRINQRKDTSKLANRYGPPLDGDFTWFQPIPIKIVAGQTLNLGTVYATPFGTAPVTITGTVKNAAGQPLAGRYVRAQTVPCLVDGYGFTNVCGGGGQMMALEPTDAAGNYTLLLRNAGTYYIYNSRCVTTQWTEYQGNNCQMEDDGGSGAVVVKVGDTKTVNLTGYF